jgi:hypothetical protein
MASADSAAVAHAAVASPHFQQTAALQIIQVLHWKLRSSPLREHSSMKSRIAARSTGSELNLRPRDSNRRAFRSSAAGSGPGKILQVSANQRALSRTIPVALPQFLAASSFRKGNAATLWDIMVCPTRCPHSFGKCCNPHDDVDSRQSFVFAQPIRTSKITDRSPAREHGYPREWNHPGMPQRRFGMSKL